MLSVIATFKQMYYFVITENNLDVEIQHNALKLVEKTLFILLSSTKTKQKRKKVKVC